MIGAILVKAAFVSCLVSVLSYIQCHRRGDPSAGRLGRRFYYGTAVFLAGVSGVMLWLILTHQFQYTYVWNYSSRELSTPLLISTFYAGQEGSFLLWTVFTTIIGIFLLRYSSRKGYEAAVMSVYGLITLMLLLMLIVKNPFLYVWESWPGQVEAGFVPANGRGLNPLLQNYWMVIHPQILFTGFAAMAVPYAYAVAAMMKRDYTHWIRPATPWIVFGALQLGTGIMMGGFWAYETLGWGGYWGWDPVENSSLVPWLMSIAAIHTILSQRKSGAFVKTNLVLAMMCFLLVLYSTFLTRSGVLGDTSVHSFVDPGMLVYWLLVGMIAIFGGLGFGMLFRRFREFPKLPAGHGYFSREFALFLGSAALVFAAFFVTIGTSSPIITQILHGKTTAVDMSFYVTTVLPIGIAIGILSGLGQLLWWTRSAHGGFVRSLIAPSLFGLAALVASLVLGVRDIPVALFVLGAAFSLGVNCGTGWRIINGSPRFAGGAIAHVGLAVMFLGFVTSSKYDEKVTLSLVEKKPVQALGYTLTYMGYRPFDKEKFAFEVLVERPGKSSHVVAPIMYYSSYTEGLMRNPDIANFVTHDFYLAPLSLEQKAGTARNEHIRLHRGERGTVGDLAIRFVDYDVPFTSVVSLTGGATTGGTAVLEVASEGGRKEFLKVGDSAVRLLGRYDIRLAGLDADFESPQNTTAEFVVDQLSKPSGPAGEKDVLVVEASVKPFINLVWAGVLILLLGFVVTIVRRAKEASLKIEG
jgi:cytochrome c-type biogenesis protein CcmF